MKDLSSPPAARRIRLRTIVPGCLLLAASVGGVALVLRHVAEPPPSLPPEPRANSSPAEDLRPQVTAFCGDCHALPSPEGFPKEAWHAEVKQGYDFYFDSGRTDLSPPDFDHVLTWFRSQAPDKIVIPPQIEAPTSGPLSFRVTTVSARGDSALPAVSFVQWCSIADPNRRALLWTDMRTGELSTIDPRFPDGEPALIGKFASPAHAQPCDLDGDGRSDLVIAELGSYLPADHHDGKVLWLRHAADGAWRPAVLQAGLGRVADVEPGDFDGDGDIDLVVAEFGWRKTGRILLLENLGTTADSVSFRMREVDSRHGTIHVPVVDLDGDGRLDFVALISQEHETVVAFLNDGSGGFRRETIFSANEPAFGSSGIELVDLDADGDLDVLYTNGDTFDSFYPKPCHSIRWFENQGGFPFRDHLLTLMPGVHRALARDLDGDGDLDIVACALLPQRSLGGERPANLDSLVWLEQTSGGRFVRHSLERGQCLHAALEAGDFDGDGDIDLAVGNFPESGRHPPLMLWWNLRRGPHEDHPP
jgi:hypothetical protein